MSDSRFEFLKKDFVQGFPAYCGVEVLRVDSGFFEAQLKVGAQHVQQNGFVHAGVMATMADHTAGYATYTRVPADVRILTIELKINYFRPAVGDRIVCRAKVINQGRRIIVAESEIFSVCKEDEKRVAKATITLMALHEPAQD